MRLYLLRTLLLASLTAPLPVGFLSAQSGSSSQPQGPPAGHHQPPTPAVELARLARVLQAASVPLSAAQQATILGILQDRDTAMKALRASNTSRETAEAQREQLMAASNASIRAALTQPQVSIFDAMRPPAGGPPASSPAPAEPPTGGAGPSDGASLIDANTGGDPHSAN